MASNSINGGSDKHDLTDRNMTYKVAITRDDTWVVYNDDDGVTIYETFDEWEALDWCDELNRIDKEESDYLDEYWKEL